MERRKELTAVTRQSNLAGIADHLRVLVAQPTSATIAEQLRELILNGHFKPGEQINEAHLASELNVSRTPLREALQRLSQEGLLASKRNHGLFMIELTKDDVGEIYSVREVLELTAAEIIMAGSARRRQEVRDKLVQIVSLLPEGVAAGDWMSVSRVDLRFHTTLVAEAGNSRLLRAYTTLAAESLICMMDLVEAYPKPSAFADDHLSMAELIATGSLKEVHSAFRRHLSVSEGELVAGLEARSRDHRLLGSARR